MNERAHVEYFDWLRIIAALSVIFMHTAAGPLRAGINTGWHLLNVCTSLAFTAVPLFFMMSGYLLMTSRKTADISVLLRHRLPRLVVPLAGWTVVAVLWQLFLAHTLTPGAIRAQLVAALNGPVMVHFWYLYTLIALYVLSPILYGGIRTLGKSGRVYLFVLAAAVSVHTVLLTVLPDGARMGQGCVGLCCVAVDGDLPHAQHLSEHALFRRRVAAFVWRHGWRDTAGVCRVLCCDENGSDRQASVLPCHRQNVCRGVPQLQLGIYLPQAARTHRDENIKTAGRRDFLRPAVCAFTFPRGAAPCARPRRRCSPVRS